MFRWKVKTSFPCWKCLVPFPFLSIWSLLPDDFWLISSFSWHRSLTLFPMTSPLDFIFLFHWSFLLTSLSFSPSSFKVVILSTSMGPKTKQYHTPEHILFSPLSPYKNAHYEKMWKSDSHFLRNTQQNFLWTAAKSLFSRQTRHSHCPRPGIFG